MTRYCQDIGGLPFCAAFKASFAFQESGSVDLRPQILNGQGCLIHLFCQVEAGYSLGVQGRGSSSSLVLNNTKQNRAAEISE